MKKFSDDDIEVLGADHERERRVMSNESCCIEDDESCHLGVNYCYSPRSNDSRLEPDNVLFENSDVRPMQRPYMNMPAKLIKAARVHDSKRPWWRRFLVPALAVLVGIAVGVVAVLWFIHDRHKDMYQSTSTAATAAPAGIETTPIEEIPLKEYITPMVDSINDVVMTFYPVDSMQVEVVVGELDGNQPDVILATTAADVRADNGEFNCEFIIDRQQLTRGIRKEGWCYVSPEGAISIGAGLAEDVKAQALEHGGCFFRQYSLVMDGEITPNILKGKSRRRALGFLDGKPVVVKSRDRESIYDFSQALADYGFSHAIYLPGGDGAWVCRTSDGIEIWRENTTQLPQGNYLTFRNTR